MIFVLLDDLNFGMMAANNLCMVAERSGDKGTASFELVEFNRDGLICIEWFYLLCQSEFLRYFSVAFKH